MSQGPSPKTRAWVAKRDATAAAIAADWAEAARKRGRDLDRIKTGYDNPAALWAGLVVLLLLLVAGALVYARLQCDPLYSDAGLFRAQACARP